MNRAVYNLKQHSALILTSVSVVGIIGTTILSIRAGIKAERILRELDGVPEDPKERIVLYAKKTWKCYVLCSLTALLSAGAAILSHKISAKDIARLATLATGSGAAFRKYRGKIKEILGEEKEKEIFDEVKVKENWGINYPRITDWDDEHYDELYVHYRLNFGVDEIPPVEFDSNPQRVTAAFYCVNRDFVLGRIIDAGLVKDYLGIPYNDVDHKYFWIDEMFYDSGMQPWIDYNIDYENQGENVTQIIQLEWAPINDEELKKIESGAYWT